jgi:predicted NACHT family NTPase
MQAAHRSDHHSFTSLIRINHVHVMIVINRAAALHRSALVPPQPALNLHIFSAASAAYHFASAIIMSLDGSEETKHGSSSREEELGRNCGQRRHPGFIAQLLAHPGYSLASRINAQHFEEMAHFRAVHSRPSYWRALVISVCHSQRLAVVCRGRLSALLVQKLIRFRSERAVKRAVKHTTAIFSRMHFAGFKPLPTECVSTLQGHSSGVVSVAFHPSAPYLATGSNDQTAKLWLLNADCSAATCVSTLKGHSSYVTSVAFHPSAPYLATGSYDQTAKVWLLNVDCSAVTCVSTLKGHRDDITSVAFHPSAPYLATGSRDNTAKLWLLNADCSAATCVSTLQGHSSYVTAVAFHTSARYLATGSSDQTAKVWLVNADCSAATCVSKLQGHSGVVYCVVFHPSAPYLVTGSQDRTAKLWLLNEDSCAGTCVLTLQGHRSSVYSVAFHPSALCLVTGSRDKTAKLWLLNADCSAATCVSTLQGHNDCVSVAFHPSAPYLATTDTTAQLWR